ncbi:MAG: hypothetical protein GY775_03200 [Candidatus Scalindua sp.]|nr:hypothetical protein [Candidatus Scalindua sp.]
MYQYDISDIFKQALQDNKAIKSILPKGVSVIGRGVKIQKFEDKTEILNMNKGGMYYKECTNEEYKLFFNHGWVLGSKYLSLSNCLHKLKIIESKIQQEMNSRKNDKHIQNLKNKRENLLVKYSNIKKEINSN